MVRVRWRPPPVATSGLLPAGRRPSPEAAAPLTASLYGPTGSTGTLVVSKNFSDKEIMSQQGRGQLRIYLGAAAGVGKTFAMLGEGHRRAEREEHDRGDQDRVPGDNIRILKRVITFDPLIEPVRSRVLIDIIARRVSLFRIVGCDP